MTPEEKRKALISRIKLDVDIRPFLKHLYADKYACPDCGAPAEIDAANRLFCWNPACRDGYFDTIKLYQRNHDCGEDEAIEALAAMLPERKF